MRTAKQLYPEYKNETKFYGPSDYNPILNQFGRILIQVDDHDYQGDSRILYEDCGRMGYLQFGWGSCSGCDALQACSTYNDIQELIDSLNFSIKWFDTKQECLEFFKNHDWESDYSHNEEEQQRFVNEVIEYLEDFLCTKKKMIVFLGGTCAESTWREKLIPMLEVDYFNPVVEDWTFECQQEELKQRKNCDICLYVITPKMEGFYSIAEVIDDSNKRPEKTVMCLLFEDDGLVFNEKQKKSLMAIRNMVFNNGGTNFYSLNEVAEYLNKKL